MSAPLDQREVMDNPQSERYSLGMHLAYPDGVAPVSGGRMFPPSTPDPKLLALLERVKEQQTAFTTGGGSKPLGMGGHTLPNEGATKVWLTPPDLLFKLGTFDLDPCAAPSPRPWSTARRHIELPEDGLTATWSGRVFCNPPYDKSIDRWIQRMVDHGSGISLIFARTETSFWQRIVWPNAKAILFLDGRLFFHAPNGARGSSNAGAPSVLLAHSEADVDVLRTSGIPGRLVTQTERIG